MKIKASMDLGLISGDEARAIATIFGVMNFEQRKNYDEYYLNWQECELTLEQLITISDYFDVKISKGKAIITSSKSANYRYELFDR